MAIDTEKIVAKGKTKTLIEVDGHPDEVEVINADVITAGDGARVDTFPKKGEYCTETNDNVFKLLKAYDVPTAYIRRTGPNTFRTKKVRMLPYEAVYVFQIAEASSMLKRESNLAEGTKFPFGRFALFLKTNDREFKTLKLPKNDPFVIKYGFDGLRVCRADMPPGGENRIVRIPPEIIFDDGKVHPFDEMHTFSHRVGVILQEAWKRLGCTLCDFKIEFGFLPDGTLVVADVIDNDSWRLLDGDGTHVDKQLYRDGAPLDVVATHYRVVAALSNKLIG